MPQAAGKWRRRRNTRAQANTWGKKAKNNLIFVLRLTIRVGAVIAFIWLIPNIPGQDAGIISKGATTPST
jgi:hypothetical protein